MRIFIGFKWQDGNGNQQHVPVLYGDMNRQVANIIKENSENKMITVPKIACYITDFELDKSRISDSSFVSKVNIRERKWSEDSTGQRNYQPVQGGNYTVERLMPTPFKLSMKADIWTSNTDQKLQLLEQILVLFNPSIELQTNDNYLDWTSLSVVHLGRIEFSTRNIPQGVDTDIDVASITFEMPVWVSPPAKVKKLGIVQTIISNVFTESGSVAELEDIAFNQDRGNFSTTTLDFGVNLVRSTDLETNDYSVSVINYNQVSELLTINNTVDWNRILESKGGFKPGSRIFFEQYGGYSLVGTFVVNPLDPSILSVSFDPETVPRNTKIDSNGNIWGYTAQGEIFQDAEFDFETARDLVDSIIDPQRYNPISTFGGLDKIPVGYRLLILKSIGSANNQDGADAWAEYKDINNPSGQPNDKVSDLVAEANSIIEWTGKKWTVIFEPRREYPVIVIVQNLKTLTKYKWTNKEWTRAFEGEYRPGTWSLVLSP